ncbi:MAG: 1,4-beta-xylanase [Rhodoglobus sp.]|nr:1,4-beta-xylanase [Rhodoglobus sp.]
MLDARGEPLRNTEVTVAQVDHAFGFGNIGFDFVPLANGERTDQLEHLAELWLDVFSTATLPFYWGDFEPERGHPATDRLLRAAEWFVERGVRVKGHPLVWHTVTAPWLLGLPLDEVEAAVRARVRREAADFAGLVTTWDAINEVVIMPVFENGENGITPLAQKLGRVGMVRLAFEEARAADPTATLHLNDFDLSPAYERLIEEVLAAGIRLDGIGLQTHMHQGYRGEDEVLAIVERFARFGIPLHFTETTLVSGDPMPADIVDLNDYRPDSWPTTPEGEARQADELVRHYRSLVAHPAVESITYWGLSDVGAWLGAPAGLVRLDGTPKPAYDALRALVKDEWWMPPTARHTDDSGSIALEGFRGRYAVTAAGRSATVALGGPTGTAQLR